MGRVGVLSLSGGGISGYMLCWIKRLFSFSVLHLKIHIQYYRLKTLNEHILHDSKPIEQTCMNTSMNSYRRRNDPQINYKITETCKVPAVSISGIAYVIIYEVT